MKPHIDHDARADSILSSENIDEPLTAWTLDELDRFAVKSWHASLAHGDGQSV